MAAMALSWLVLIIYFLTHIQGQQFSFPNGQIPIMECPTLPWKGIFPPRLLLAPCVKPVGESHIEQIRKWYNESGTELKYAQDKLGELEDTSEVIDWDVSLYQLIIAYIVNFRPRGEVSYEWIDSAADEFELDYIPFTDLAEVPIWPYNNSGPFCGVFVTRDGNPNPFMILSFKGTTNEYEAATNYLITPTEQDDGTLYNQAVHTGMYYGLFVTFPNASRSAFDTIWEQLDRVATENLGGSVDNPVPLYVSGHSLGAGYAQLAYVELFRKLQAKISQPYKLKSLYAFAAPRVAAILGTGFAQTVKEVFEGSGKPIFRYSNEYDVVPFAPGIVTVAGPVPCFDIVQSGWVHLDGGYILKRNSTNADYTLDTSEIGRLPKDDQDGRTSWEHHFPDQYYYSIKKIINETYNDLPDSIWPPPQLKYPPCL
jgi:hypothetical protein